MITVIKETIRTEKKEIGADEIIKMLRDGASIEVKSMEIRGWNVTPHDENRAVITEVIDGAKNTIILDIQDLVKLVKECVHIDL